MNHSDDDVVIPDNNNITKLTSLKDCAQHIINLADNQDGNTQTILFDIPDVITGTTAYYGEAIDLLRKLKNKGVELGMCGPNLNKLTYIRMFKDVCAENISSDTEKKKMIDSINFSGAIALSYNEKQQMIHNITLDKSLDQKTATLYKELFIDQKKNINNDKSYFILEHYVYQKYFKGSNKVDITYLDSDIKNLYQENTELCRLIDAKLLTITRIPMSSMIFQDSEKTTKQINGYFSLADLVAEVKKIIAENKNQKNTQKTVTFADNEKPPAHQTLLQTQQKPIDLKLLFGLNPAYEKDNKILSLYYRATKYSFKESTITGASPAFKKMQKSKKQTLGTDSGRNNKLTEKDLFNNFFYKMLKITDQEIKRGLVNGGFYVYR